MRGSRLSASPISLWERPALCRSMTRVPCVWIRRPMRPVVSCPIDCPHPSPCVASRSMRDGGGFYGPPDNSSRAVIRRTGKPQETPENSVSRGRERGRPAGRGEHGRCRRASGRSAALSFPCECRGGSGRRSRRWSPPRQDAGQPMPRTARSANRSRNSDEPGACHRGAVLPSQSCDESSFAASPFQPPLASAFGPGAGGSSGRRRGCTGVPGSCGGVRGACCRGVVCRSAAPGAATPAQTAPQQLRDISGFPRKIVGSRKIRFKVLTADLRS